MGLCYLNICLTSRVRSFIRDYRIIVLITNNWL